MRSVHPSACQHILASALTLACCGAWADAETSIDIRAKYTQEQVKSDSTPVQDTLTFSYGGGTGASYANLETGILRDYAVAPPRPSEADFSYALAQSRIGDVITFAPSASGTAYLHWSADGSLTAFDGASESSASMSIIVAGGTNRIDETHAYTNFSCAPYNVTSCEAGTHFSQSGMVAFEIAGDNPIDIQAVLGTNPSDGGTGDFSNTGRLYLVVPAGETFTSASGVFLAEASPVTSVPEPASLSLLIEGMALLAARRMRS